MPTGLRRFQQMKHFHFVTFSCYKREPFLRSTAAKDTVEQVLEQTRQQQGLHIAAYVVMPEHIHLLTSEPTHDTLATFLQILKQLTARELKLPEQKQFWQRRYYDFNVSSHEKVCRETPVHPPQPCKARPGHQTRRLPPRGAASPTTRRENPAPSKSNPNGPPAVANAPERIRQSHRSEDDSNSRSAVLTFPRPHSLGAHP